MIYKRKLQRKTNYRKRLILLKSKKARLVIRKSLKNVLAQIVQYTPDGDKVLFSAHTNELKKKYDWKAARGNTPSAYLVGLLIGVKAKQNKIKDAILDVGLIKLTKNTIISAVLKGALDAGLNIAHSKDILPSEERIKGKHIAEYAKINKGKFTKYNPENLLKDFESVKSKILK